MNQQQQKQLEGVSFSLKHVFVLLPDFSNKLYIPRSFRKRISNLQQGDAILRGPLGEPWRVKVQEDAKGLYFGDGWTAFCIAHDLEVGWFLVFEYGGSMVFGVSVFDVSGSEKVYAPKERLVPDMMPPAPCPPERPNARQQPKATVCQGEQAATSALRLGPHIRVTMKSCFLHKRKPYMNIQDPLFQASYAHKDHINLRDTEGKKWPVNIYHRRKKGKIYSIFGSGWPEFHAHHNLKIGDSCIFEITDENNIINVHIFRKL